MQPLEATFNQIWWQVPLRSIIQLQHSGTPILPPGGSSSCPRSHSPYALHFTWRLSCPKRLLSCSSSFIAKPGDYLTCLVTSYRPRMVLHTRQFRAQPYSSTPYSLAVIWCRLKPNPAQPRTWSLLLFMSLTSSAICDFEFGPFCLLEDLFCLGSQSLSFLLHVAILNGTLLNHLVQQEPS